jgi:Rrf2 family iron-sulfur cluster assembly transcriptional regulator
MQLTTKGRYAVNALLDLALHDSEGPVALADIAKRQSISQTYLEQLFGKLKRHALVTSSRGPHGGYRLALGTEKISIAKIIYSVDEKVDITRCHGKQNCQKDQRCLTHDLWMELNMHVSGFLNGITLFDLIQRNNVKDVAQKQDFAFVKIHKH